MSPGVRPRDVATTLGVTERAYSIVTDLTEGGYVVKEKDGRATATRSRLTYPCARPSLGNGRSVRC